jgi:hypothetical protein
MPQRGVRKFTTWEYRRHGIVVKVPVMLVDAAQSPLRDDHPAKTYFLVELADPEIRETHTDINELQQIVFAELAAQLAINWQNVLVVTVTGDRERLFAASAKADTPATRASGTVGLTLCWTRWQIAEVNGQKISREFDYYPSLVTCPEGKLPREIWQSTVNHWPLDAQVATRRRGRQRTEPLAVMIPDTPAHRQALETLAGQLSQLREQLQRLLGKRQVVRTLAQLAATGVLDLIPAPAPATPAPPTN